MRNPATAVICGPCRVAVTPVLHPQPETMISCPQCGATDTFRDVTAECLEQVKQRFSRATGRSAESTDWKWRYRDTTPPRS